MAPHTGVTVLPCVQSPTITTRSEKTMARVPLSEKISSMLICMSSPEGVARFETSLKAVPGSAKFSASADVVEFDGDSFGKSVGLADGRIEWEAISGSSGSAFVIEGANSRARWDKIIRRARKLSAAGKMFGRAHGYNLLIITDDAELSKLSAKQGFPGLTYFWLDDERRYTAIPPRAAAKAELN